MKKDATTTTTQGEAPADAAPLFDAQQAARHCQLVGIEPGDALIRTIHWSGHPAIPLPPTGRARTAQIERLQQQGHRAYLIPGGADKDEDVTSISSTFAEWDDLLLEDTIALLHEAQVRGLPQHALLLRTWKHGSPHVWWRLAEPCTDIPRWRRLTTRLVVALGSDPVCVNPSRLMRLAGTSYIAKAGHPRAGQILGQAEILHEDDDATTTIEELEAWLDAEFARRPDLHKQLKEVSWAANRGKAAFQPPSDDDRRTKEGGLLPPRTLADIKTALETIKKRESGLPPDNPLRHPYHRFALIGLRDALYRLTTGTTEERIAAANRQARDLMEAHSPSKECGWNISQQLSSSFWLNEGCFWRRAIDAGWNPRLAGIKAEVLPPTITTDLKLLPPGRDPALPSINGNGTAAAQHPATAKFQAIEAELHRLACLSVADAYANNPEPFLALLRSIADWIETGGDDAMLDPLIIRIKETLGISIPQARKVIKNRRLEIATARKRERETQRKAAKEERAARGITFPFQILGWDPLRRRIAYRAPDSGQLGELSTGGHGPSELVAAAPLAFWQANYPVNDAAVDWVAAKSDLAAAADAVGVFDPALSCRGRGLYMDRGRVVAHLGNRLLVDGVSTPVAEFQDTDFVYQLGTATTIDFTGPQLTDEQGQAIVDAVAAVGWLEPHACRYLLGWIVTAIAAGALRKRPGIQATGPRGTGKSTVLIDHIARPLLGPFLGGAVSGVTEAFVRQAARYDTLPWIIDESEAGDAKGTKRTGHLQLARLSFDGLPSGRGTTHGQASNQCVRFSLALIGINAAIPDPADRSRIATITRKHLPSDAWAKVEQGLKAAITPEIGHALLRRVVGNLPTLIHNIEALSKAVAKAAEPTHGSAAARYGDTIGTLLAAAHFLGSTEQLTDEAAKTKAAEVFAESGHAVTYDAAEDDEARDCLDHLLAHRVRWMEKEGTPAGETTVGGLIDMVKGTSGTLHVRAAEELLASLGVRVNVTDTLTGLAVANNTPGIKEVFAATRWKDGGHQAHLAALPDAERMGQRKARFGPGLPQRYIRIPWWKEADDDA